jgi:hypothetical protein
MTRMTCVSGALAAALAAAANAAIVTTSSEAAFSIIAQANGYSQNVSFSGFTATSGGSSWNAWQATSSFGAEAFQGNLRPIFPDEALTISFAPGAVYAVGGNIFNTTTDGQVMASSLIEITLADGSSYVSESSATNFAGFVSTAGAISSIRIATAFAGPDDFPHATIGRLVLAGVPAPGSLALLATAGFAARRRRR